MRSYDLRSVLTPPPAWGRAYDLRSVLTPPPAWGHMISGQYLTPTPPACIRAYHPHSHCCLYPSHRLISNSLYHRNQNVFTFVLMCRCVYTWQDEEQTAAQMGVGEGSKVDTEEVSFYCIILPFMQSPVKKCVKIGIFHSIFLLFI